MVQRDREGWQLTMILCHLSHLARWGGRGGGYSVTDMVM